MFDMTTPHIRNTFFFCMLLLMLSMGADSARCYSNAKTCGGDICPADSDCTLDGEGCVFNGCGNGVVDGDEVCDDGNVRDGDECSSTCGLDECGNGRIEEGEICDDSGNSALCDADCTSAECGDGYVNGTAGEDCDRGSTIDLRTCDSDCTAVVCGDGHVNAAALEQCDDGGETADCDDDCTLVVCNDGNLNEAAGEECEDGNGTSGDGCSSDCQLEGA